MFVCNIFIEPMPKITTTAEGTMTLEMTSHLDDDDYEDIITPPAELVSQSVVVNKVRNVFRHTI